MQNYDFKVYLGKDKDTAEEVYLNGFSWDCDWYYGGGYLSYYKGIRQTVHTHFNATFLNSKINGEYGIWKSLDSFLNDAQFNEIEWWRIKDLYKQFYSLKNAAETFQFGGHCIGEGRNPKEINKDMADRINTHIQDVIIPEIVKALKIENHK